MDSAADDGDRIVGVLLDPISARGRTDLEGHPVGHGVVFGREHGDAENAADVPEILESSSCKRTSSLMER